MKTNSNSKGAFLWDESLLWGIMAYKALKANNLAFELISSDDIRNGRLNQYSMLFVPAGWASNKLKTLGDEGEGEIKRFVSEGGSYLGFCGGAGLATLEGIGLLHVKRKPTKERIPSFSGRIHLTTDDHPIWDGITTNVFHVWWPSQFLIKDKSIKILATYGKALPDSFSSDLNVGDVEANGSWSELEETYQINLDPGRFMNEPAVIEGISGKGKVILSLIHFDTPDDGNGEVVLSNLWKYLTPEAESGISTLPTLPLPLVEKKKACPERSRRGEGVILVLNGLISELETTVSDLITLGERNFLWFWRNPMLLQWRRGVRGLEYCTLYIMIKQIEEMIHRQLEINGQKYSIESQLSKANCRPYFLNTELNSIRELLVPFVKKAKKLLILERLSLNNGYITYKRCDNSEIQKIREELFSTSKSHGGMFKKLINEVSKVSYSLIKEME